MVREAPCCGAVHRALAPRTPGFPGNLNWLRKEPLHIPRDSKTGLQGMPGVPLARTLSLKRCRRLGARSSGTRIVGWEAFLIFVGLLARRNFMGMTPEGK